MVMSFVKCSQSFYNTLKKCIHVVVGIHASNATQTANSNAKYNEVGYNIK